MSELNKINIGGGVDIKIDLSDMYINIDDRNIYRKVYSYSKTHIKHIDNLLNIYNIETLLSLMKYGYGVISSQNTYIMLEGNLVNSKWISPKGLKEEIKKYLSKNTKHSINDKVSKMKQFKFQGI